MDKTLVYDQGVHAIANAYELHSRGVKFVCPQCGGELEFNLDTKKARPDAKRPGIYCPTSESHISVCISPVSASLLPELSEIKLNRGWPKGCNLIARIASPIDQNGRWTELELVEIRQGLLNLSRIAHGHLATDYREQSRFYESLSDLVSWLEAQRLEGRLAEELEPKLLAKLKET